MVNELKLHQTQYMHQTATLSHLRSTGRSLWVSGAALLCYDISSLNKLDRLQSRATQWVLPNEKCYMKRLPHLNLLPVSSRLQLNDFFSTIS